MLKVSTIEIDRAGEYIKKYSRPLEQAKFSYLFRNTPAERLIGELKRFQNTDGGFGNGLEPDFLLPKSSPLASTLAFQYLDEITEPDKDMLKKTIKYFEETFVEDRLGWFTVSEEVNIYPHAEWWNWDKDKKQTSIDASWGNPSAEIIGYLIKYRQYVTSLDVDTLVEHAITYWEEKKEFADEHEVYCYIRFYKCLPITQRKRLEKTLREATKQLVTVNPEQWKGYIPQPLHFVENPNFFLFDVVKDAIDTNLDYLITSINTYGVWSPNWKWGQYETDWQKSKVAWEGILTIKNIAILKVYNRIEE